MHGRSGSSLKHNDVLGTVRFAGRIIFRLTLEIYVNVMVYMIGFGYWLQYKAHNFIFCILIHWELF